MSLAHDGICFCQWFKIGLYTHNPVNERNGDFSPTDQQLLVSALPTIWELLGKRPSSQELRIEDGSLSLSDLMLDFCGGGALRCRVATHLGSSGLGSLRLI